MNANRLAIKGGYRFYRDKLCYPTQAPGTRQLAGRKAKTVTTAQAEALANA